MKISKADKYFSYYIRLRGAWESNGVLLNKCFTCDKILPCSQLDCGHFIKRQHKGTRFSEVNTACQCRGCNWLKQGNDVEFEKRLNLKHGEHTADLLRAQGRKPHKVMESLIAEHYKDLVSNILVANGWTKYKWW